MCIGHASTSQDLDQSRPDTSLSYPGIKGENPTMRGNIFTNLSLSYFLFPFLFSEPETYIFLLYGPKNTMNCIIE